MCLNSIYLSLFRRVNETEEELKTLWANYELNQQTLQVRLKSNILISVLMSQFHLFIVFLCLLLWHLI